MARARVHGAPICNKLITVKQSYRMERERGIGRERNERERESDGKSHIAHECIAYCTHAKCFSLCSMAIAFRDRVQTLIDRMHEQEGNFHDYSVTLCTLYS